MKNLVKLYHTVNPSHITEGLIWYPETRAYCDSLATANNLPLSKVVAIFSALSPGTNFEQNKKDCLNLIKGNQGRAGRYKFATYGQNVLKAQNIFKGLIDPFTAFSHKTGAKTLNFFWNILQPDNPDYVTIDRHAYRVATGEEYTQLTPKQYRLIAEHYKRAADKLGLIPNQLQAILWLHYRAINNIQQKPAPF